jgi:hypothetical protein
MLANIELPHLNPHRKRGDESVLHEYSVCSSQWDDLKQISIKDLHAISPVCAEMVRRIGGLKH